MKSEEGEIKARGGKLIIIFVLLPTTLHGIIKITRILKKGKWNDNKS